ncbi:Alpha/Beta hydrolase protein [Dioszegia hungarica]|uniref:Alpha/Beta hydrolase protein n=1 Tax=Dioszegia hungarica TaxID=4972 RepID=A0AA38LT97_9TREE|nr:Alpha/Beta hydrolase protein [Dioszegia hungarica]KAI9632341.1 Alpha/Beta hydrolase protein [Dioszegia hungarica]
MSVTNTAACCTLPPVQAEYTPKGSYSDFTGLKTYITGEKDAKQAVLIVYDVFGFSPQILQGADLLASQGYAVYMPDFLGGDYAQPEWFSGSEEGTKMRTTWFSKFPGSISSQAKPVGNVISEIKSKHGQVGAAGFCWGWKVLVMTENGDKLAGIAGCHPSLIAADDVEKLSVPVALLPSEGEDMKIINEIYEGLEKKSPGSSFVKEYPKMPHGWMAARGDLKGEEGSKAFHDGYSTLAAFFKQNMK